MPWSDYPLTTLTLPQGAGPGQPREVFNAYPVPPELVTYYQTPPLAPANFTAPETIAWVNQYFDAAGDYAYDAMVTDSSAMPKTSLVQGAVVGGVVTESHRFALNPGATLGGGRFEYFNERAILVLTDPTSGTTVLSTRHPTDTFDVFSCNVLGTLGWGDGTALTTSYLRQTASARMEFGGRLDIRGFNLLSDTMFSIFKDGDANIRVLIRADGQIRWADGTHASDLGLFRRAVNELSTDGDFSLSALGAGILIKTGANCTLGTAVLAGGTVTIANTNVTATCIILLTCQAPAGTPGDVRVTAKVAGTSFTITSSSAADTSTIGWLILYPA